MRAVALLVALLVAPGPALAGPATCEYAERLDLLVYSTSYYAAWERSYCRSTDGKFEQHSERVVLTEGDPRYDTSRVVAALQFLSSRTVKADGSTVVEDSVTLTASSTWVGANYKGTRTAAGFASCTAGVKYGSGSSSGSFTTSPLPACPPQDFLLV